MSVSLMFLMLSLQKVTILFESLPWIHHFADRLCCCTQFLFLSVSYFSNCSLLDKQDSFFFMWLSCWSGCGYCLFVFSLGHQDVCVCLSVCVRACVCVVFCPTGMKKDTGESQHGSLCVLAYRTQEVHAAF